MTFRWLPKTVAAAAVASLAGPAAGQVKYPAPPEQSHVDLRYRIRADRDERIRQHRAMTDRLRSLGFEPDGRQDADLDVFDPAAERLSGTIKTANVRELLNDSRIKAVLVTPAGSMPFDDPAKPTEVRIELAAGLDPSDQRRLHEQSVRQLVRLGFREGVGYDHIGFSRVRGSMPAGKVPLLLKDLRDLPEGWFVAAVSRDQLPLPLRRTQPVVRVDVLPEVEGLTPLSPPPPTGKLGGDVRAVLADATRATRPLRVEVLTAPALAPGATAFRAALRADLFGSTLEGVAGNVATVRLSAAGEAEKLALRPEVLGVRLPRAGVESFGPAALSSPEATLSAANVSALHAVGYTGRGERVVIIGAGFPTAADMIGKGLPASTRVIDLTAELSPQAEPLPPTVGGDATAAAVAAHAAAPGADLILVRVDPAAFHQLLTVGRAVTGSANSEAIRSRGQELTDRAEALAVRRETVLSEYRKAFADLSGEESDLDEAIAEIGRLEKKAKETENPGKELVDRIEFLKRQYVRLPAKLRKDATAAVEKLTADEKQLGAMVNRLRSVRAGLEALGGAAVVVNALVWPVGVPADGQSELGRLIDEKFTRQPSAGLKPTAAPPLPTWVQASADAGAAMWAGPFLDADGNGVLEFAPSTALRPGGSWTAELNFVGNVAADGKRSADLPPGAKLRFTMQWKEPRSPEVGSIPEPVLVPTLRLVRQIDPTGAKAASDELVEVARSAGTPVPVLRSDMSAVYEQTLEVTVPVAGRYALRVEGRATADSPLPGLRRSYELYPRLAVQGADGSNPAFESFVGAAGVGVPGDVRGALTVGSVGGPTGSGPGLALSGKPDIIFPGAVVVNGNGVGGSGVSAGFVGGVAACLAQAGVIGSNLPRTLGVTPGQPLVLPAEWIRSLSPPRP